jgi:hypothetical protein
MYAHLFVSIVFMLMGVAAAAAQEAPAPQDHAGHVMPAGQDEHAGHVMPAGGVPAARQGSGTSWLPDDTPVYAFHQQRGQWTLMGHGNAFLQYLYESGDRGSEQTGSINWLMGMAQRPAGAGRFTLRGMVSFEPWTIGGCGYPDLLATGELCEGETIHDRQHPHDLFMELAGEYDRPLAGGVRLQLYGGAVGEPALGPVAFMHRISGLPNALAPMTHHWFDATHITFGVATAGIYKSRWKVEGSVFNGREPDEDRTDFDFAAMDSWSARAWFNPSARWALQVSAGHLEEAEVGHDGGARVSVDRVTASATYHRRVETSVSATTIGWGQNAEGDERTNAVMVESAMTWRDRDAVYGRAEWAQKSGHDLDVPLHDVFNVTKLQAGYTRYFGAWRGLVPGAGAALSSGIVPRALEPFYGSRVNAGIGVYVTLRPAASGM